MANRPEHTPPPNEQKNPVQTVTINTVAVGLRLDRWLRQQYPHVSFAQFQKKIRKGEIRLNGKRIKGAERLGLGDRVRIPPLPVPPPPTVSSTAKKTNTPHLQDKDFIRDLLIYQTDNVIAINKPAGLAVQGGSGIKRHIDGMLPWLQTKGDDVPRLVHRLDKDTSGVMMLARNRETAHALGQFLRHRQTRKIYWALVVGELQRDFGIIDEPLVKGGARGSERIFVNHQNPDAKQAITWFSVLERLGNNLSLVALWPRTGRTHQLRVHMAALGCPIMGDGKYGGAFAHISDANHAKKLTLHARELVDPLTNTTIVADLPDHMQQTFDMLGVNSGDFAPTIDPFAPLLED